MREFVQESLNKIMGNFLVEYVHMKHVAILPGLQLVYKADEQSHHS